MKHTHLTIMPRLRQWHKQVIVSFLLILGAISCSHKENAVYFVIEKGALLQNVKPEVVFKLALDEKKSKKLNSTINDYLKISLESWANFEINIHHPPDCFSEYSLVGYDHERKVVHSKRFSHRAPFQFEYIYSESSGYFWNRKTDWGVGLYTVEDYFTDEEKQKMYKLIPFWKTADQK